MHVEKPPPGSAPADAAAPFPRRGNLAVQYLRHVAAIVTRQSLHFQRRRSNYFPTFRLRPGGEPRFLIRLPSGGARRTIPAPKSAVSFPLPSRSCATVYDDSPTARSGRYIQPAAERLRRGNNHHKIITNSNQECGTSELFRGSALFHHPGMTRTPRPCWRFWTPRRSKPPSL